MTYAECCLPRGIRWGRNSQGKLTKQVELSEDTTRMLEDHMEQLEKDLGRPLEDDDLLFPELAAMDQDELTTIIVRHLTRAGIDPAFIYAFQQTGLLITEDNIDRVSSTDRQEWDDAVAEYRTMQN
jgi:hypothetical protein